MTRLERLRARLNELLEVLRTLAAVDADELSEEQDARLAAIEPELERTEGEQTLGLLADIDREQRREELRSRALAGVGTERGDGARIGEGVNVTTRTSDPFDLSAIPAYGPERDREVRARALDAVQRSSRYLSDEHKRRTTELLQRHGQEQHYAEFVLLGSSEAYADGFLRALTGAAAGLAPDFTPEERAAITQRHLLARAIGLSDVTGVLVPSHLDTMLILANDGRTNPLRRVARQETGTTNVYRSVRTAGVTHNWTSENAEVADNSPGFANPTATAFKGTVFVPISFEAFEDARGRESDILAAMDDAVDEAEATVFISGNGTTMPRGLITALDANTNAEVANITSNTFGIEDVYNVYERVPPRYRNDRTAWLANMTIINDVRQFGDDTFHSQTVQLGARTVPAILDHPALEASDMDAAITAGATDNILAVGDPQTYLIYDRLGASVEFVPNLFGTTNGRPTGQRGWLMHHRTGANLVVGHAPADTVVGWRLLQAVTNP